MIATEIFRKNHRTIRNALVSLDRALLMQTAQWDIIAKNLAGYLEIEIREYWGSEERWIFTPLRETGPDAAGVVAQMKSCASSGTRSRPSSTRLPRGSSPWTARDASPV